MYGKVMPHKNDRWSKSRRSIVAYAVMNGHLSRQEALSKYAMSEEELMSWIIQVKENKPLTLKALMESRKASI